MIWWKGMRIDEIWGEVPYYRFPFLAWLLDELRFFVAYRCRYWRMYRRWNRNED